MRIRHQNRYPVAADALYGVFTDRAYYEDYYGRAGGRHEFIEFGPAHGRFVINVRRFMRMKPGAQVPAIARKFVREENVLHIVMDWRQGEHGIHHGTYRYAIEGVPVEISGQSFIEPAGDGCVHRIEAEVKCSIPLVGGKIAAMVGERAEKSRQKDYEAVMAWLGSRQSLAGA